MRFINAVICTLGVFVFLFGLAGLILSDILSFIEPNELGTFFPVLFVIGGIALFWWGNHRDELWYRPHSRGHGYSSKKIIIILVIIAVVFLLVFFLNKPNTAVTDERYQKLVDELANWKQQPEIGLDSKGCLVCTTAFEKKNIVACGGIPKYDFVTCSTSSGNRYLDIFTLKEISKEETDKRREAWTEFLSKG